MIQRVYQVGGCVRDRLLGVTPNDIDWVAAGFTHDDMISAGFTQVGSSFPVYLHPETKEEYALARREMKTGPKHGDFVCEFGPEVSLIEDLARRDFSCNAIAYCPMTSTFYDPFGGADDVAAGRVRHLNTAFSDDPLRVLRGIRFASQDWATQGLAADTKAVIADMIRSGCLSHLSKDRIREEFSKFFSRADPAKAIELCNELGVTERLLGKVSEEFCKTGLSLDVGDCSSIWGYSSMLASESNYIVEQFCKNLGLSNIEAGIIKTHSTVWNSYFWAEDASADDLYVLLSNIDAFRRPERFGRIVERINENFHGHSIVMLWLELYVAASEPVPTVPESLRNPADAKAYRKEHFMKRLREICLRRDRDEL